MNIGSKPPVSILKHFSYNPSTGEFLRLKRRGKAMPGDRADKPDAKGYRRVWFCGKHYQAHRLAWFFHYGEWPKSMLDHANIDRSDNKICNLRLATPSQNAANTGKARGSLKKGVTIHKPTGKYQAQVRKDGVNKYLGLFLSEDEAHEAYTVAAVELFGEFARASMISNVNQGRVSEALRGFRT